MDRCAPGNLFMQRVRPQRLGYKTSEPIPSWATVSIQGEAGQGQTEDWHRMLGLSGKLRSPGPTSDRKPGGGGRAAIPQELTSQSQSSGLQVARHHSPGMIKHLQGLVLCPEQSRVPCPLVRPPREHPQLCGLSGQVSEHQAHGCQLRDTPLSPGPSLPASLGFPVLRRHPPPTNTYTFLQRTGALPGDLLATQPQ